jgi:hypothetical protein
VTAGRLLAIAGSIVVLAVLALALRELGSPSAQREVRMDERREHDLSMLAVQVRGHWLLERALPPDLATLASKPGSTLSTRDPATGAPYEYEIVADDRYRLCATFTTDTAQDRVGRRRVVNDYPHARGRQCFDKRAGAVND